ncbi:hypothetical protein [Tepidimonas fonticaldi]|nr:hypothetical protein [Tepidimonas fonticaldi]
MLQNRVNPRGELCAVPSRGTLMGNRGILHDANQRIVKPWAHHAWVTCLLEYKGIQRPRPFSTPNNYSELFFLDEATAFSAGHRPCNFCQRERAQAFKTAWFKANPDACKEVSLKALDSVLHRERVDRNKNKLTYDARLDSLPVGAFFVWKNLFLAKTRQGCLEWSFDGYRPGPTVPASEVVQVLTPRSVVNAFAQGFEPRFHATALNAS